MMYGLMDGWMDIVSYMFECCGCVLFNDAVNY
jgi:hypothetical protein